MPIPMLLVVVVVAVIGLLATTLGGFSLDVLALAGLNLEFWLPKPNLFDVVFAETAGSTFSTILFSFVDDWDVDEELEAELSRPVDGMLLEILGIDDVPRLFVF